MSAVRTRVVITGMGVVTPLGNTLGEFTTHLLTGVSGAGQVSRFDVTDWPTQIAAEVKACTPLSGFRDPKIDFALTAARLAVDDANRGGATLAQHYVKHASRLSLGLGLELFNMSDMLDWLKRAPGTQDYSEFDALRRLEYLQTPSDLVVGLLAREFAINRPPLIHVSACSASTDAIGVALQLIRQEPKQWILAGGTDSMINPLGFGGFCRLQAMTQKNTTPKQASRPFDRQRDGFLMGEGAAWLILESLEQAHKRGAKIYAELAGYGNSFDAYGISEPHPQGEGAVRAMNAALRDAAISPAQILYLNAHGTSTPKNDKAETNAIKQVFGAMAYALPVSSTKSMLGHLISASGAVELAATLCCADRGYAHPTLNYQEPDPECDLDYIVAGKRKIDKGYIMKNSFAFGGQNASLIVNTQMT